MNEEQYALICARRQAFDNLVWQTPPLAIATQSFLLAAAFNPDYSSESALAMSCFSLFAGLASIQLMAKHRHHEREDCELLKQFERDHAADGYSLIHGRRPQAGLNSLHLWLRSFHVWLAVLVGLCFLAGYAAFLATHRPSPTKTTETPAIESSRVAPELAKPSG